MIHQPCPLCHHIETNFFYHGPYRDYWRCPICKLIYVPPKLLLSPRHEKTRYDLHENNPDDPDYRTFLNQLAQPLIERIGPPPLKGLDFGSGPGPTLSVMLEEQGYDMTVYDPFYANHPAVLTKTYDFVTCTETIEHIYFPEDEWELLLALVKPGGWLGFMTKLIDTLENFSDMHYIKDQTHVRFYSRATFRYLAEYHLLTVEFLGDNVILMQKSSF